MSRFMKRAFDLAKQNVAEGGQPFGAVLVKDDEIIGEGVNELHLKHDVSGHAELLAIRRAQHKLQTSDLEGAIMYASGEPCPMCYTAMYFSNIRKVYFGAPVEEAAKNGLDASKILYDDFKRNREERETMEMIHLPIKEGEVDPLSLWQQKR